MPRVQKPGRYTGGELYSHNKDWDGTPVRMALSYPDIYEIGMSNNGLAILYDVVNQHNHFLCERVYVPWLDMEAELRANSVPLFSLESRRSIGDFDIFGISLGWEMTYTNVLTMLDLAGIPLRSQERQSPFPIVMGGGSGALNGEPMADFFDVFLMGEGEELLVEFCRMVEEYKAVLAQRGVTAPGRAEREELLRNAARIPGVYVPEFYQVSYHPDGRVERIEPTIPDAPRVVAKRQLERLLPTLTTPVMPFIQTIHDRASIEIQRGCTRGCRFCQAGIIYRPLRERTHEEVIEAVEELMTNCGYTEFSLVSLSTSDYHDLPGPGPQAPPPFPPSRHLYLAAQPPGRDRLGRPRGGDGAYSQGRLHVRAGGGEPAAATGYQQTLDRRRPSQRSGGRIQPRLVAYQALLHDWPAHGNP